MLLILFTSVSRIRQDSKVTRTLDSRCELSLMVCASACYSSGKNLSSVRSETAKLSCILIVDCVDLFNAEGAYLSAVPSVAGTGLIKCHLYFLQSNQNGRPSSDAPPSKE